MGLPMALLEAIIACLSIYLLWKAQESVESSGDRQCTIVCISSCLASNERAGQVRALKKDKHLTRECKRHSSICFGTKNERLWSTITVDFLKRKAHLLVI